MNFYLKQLKEAGFTTVELKKADYTASELKNKGFTAKELKEAGFTLQEIKKAGYKAWRLKELTNNSYISKKDLIDAGYSEKEINENVSIAKQRIKDEIEKLEIMIPSLVEKLIEEGFTLNEINPSGNEINPSGNEINSIPSGKRIKYQLKHTISRYSLKDHREAGFTATQLKESEGTSFPYNPSAINLKEAGFTLEQLKEAGFDLDKLMKAGFTASELKVAGFTASELKHGGLPGFTLKELIDAKYSLLELYEADFHVEELKEEGINAKGLRNEGFDLKKLARAGFPAKQLKKAEYTASELKDAGYTAKELKDAGFEAEELYKAGYKKYELKDAGFTLQNLIDVGITLNYLNKDAQFALSKFIDAGYSAKELKEAGFTQGELEKEKRENKCIEYKPTKSYFGSRHRKFYKEKGDLYYNYDGIKFKLKNIRDLNNTFDIKYSEKNIGNPDVFEIKDVCMLYNGHIYDKQGKSIMQGKNKSILLYLLRNDILEKLMTKDQNKNILDKFANEYNNEDTLKKNLKDIEDKLISFFPENDLKLYFNPSKSNTQNR